MSSIILITGTSKGIGEYLANHYLSKDNIVIGFSRNTPAINNKNYTHYNLDITDEKEVVKTVRKVHKDFGKIDVLINNAGVAIMNHLVFTPLKAAEKVFNINFFGTFLLTREVVKIMAKNKYGRIVNFSSVAAPLSLEGESIYGSSKAAIESFTKTAAKEVSRFNITVNALAPTPVETDLIKGLPKENISELINQQTIKRIGKFEDISNVIDFFIKKESDFITGQIMYLGGI